jgi:hypothetical protein
VPEEGVRGSSFTLADMEGPAVKRFLRRIGSTLVRRVSEGGGAQQKMRRLRRRIRLICAGCQGQSRMTVVRRELPPSRSASRPAWWRRRRIASARALQSCPHHAGAAAPQKTDHQIIPPLLVLPTPLPLVESSPPRESRPAPARPRRRRWAFVYRARPDGDSAGANVVGRARRG